ncbi:MAG TPA: AraC family transcriptional regulator [Tepidisphaeraceae bacterium]|jgi:AraC-like DNA-binding protein|nr:AraC family transcriptional regulator [Tepidisphaeraceae bacterium]
MATAFKNRLLYKGGIPSKIGRLIESAVVANSSGTGPMRILDAYCIVYVLEGRCLYEHPGGDRRTFAAGDFFFVFPGIPHTYGAAPDNRWSQFYILFEGAAFDLWRSRGLLDPDRFAYHLQPVDYWLGRFESMFDALHRGDPHSMQPVCALQALLAEAIESHGHSPAERENVVWLRQAFEKIAEGDAAARLDMASLAEAMGMSYAAFRKKFTALARMSPGRYHASLVMRRACQWMHEELVSSKEIARRLGFCNEYHFSRRFKQVVGVAPSAYRRRLSQAAPVGGPEMTSN